MTKKIYFVSDLHLGVGASVSSEERERQFVRWLGTVAQDAEAIYLIGDIFEFWFEYKTVIPKGFARFFAKIISLREAGIPIYFFTGNHDIWMFDYFEKEFGIPTYRQPIVTTLKGKKFLIGHGDGLGPEDTGYKLLKKVFTNPICQWLFGWVHPDFGIAIANYWSGKSRAVKYLKRRDWLGAENEWLVAYCERKITQFPDIEYFIFGHRHLPIDYSLKNSNTKYFNTGDWLNYNSYAIFDGEKIEIKFWEKEAVNFEY